MVAAATGERWRRSDIAFSCWDNGHVFLKCCVNGVRQRADHPALPVTPAEVANDVARDLAAGADAVHVHPKDADGRDTLDPRAVAAVVTETRAISPAVSLGTTTGAWIDPDPYRRVAAIAAWTVRPDFASVNWHEAGAEDVAVALLDRGVGVEAGLWHVEAARAWLESPLRNACVRVLVELADGLDEIETVVEADRILDVLHDAPGNSAPILLHGQDSSAWPALRRAAELGLQARIGLEDVLTLPGGTRAPDNAALVTAARLIGGS
jgi:uncharacterized protein (DUF849 family)